MSPRFFDSIYKYAPRKYMLYGLNIVQSTLDILKLWELFLQVQITRGAN